MQHLEVSGAVRPLYGSLGVKGLILAPGLYKEYKKSKMIPLQALFGPEGG